MGLLFGIIWIVAGIVYILYKIGSDEFRGGVFGGILTIILPFVFLLVVGGSFWLASKISDEWGMLVWMCILIVCFIIWRIKQYQKDSKEREEREAWFQEMKRKAHMEDNHDHK